MSEDAGTEESFGVLIGWGHHVMGKQLDLKLQCVRSTRRMKQNEIDDHHIVMTRDQAAVLANYLLKIAGHTPPAQPRGKLARWFA